MTEHEPHGPCDHCGKATTNWYRNHNGQQGFECDQCLDWIKRTNWGDIHA